MTRITGFLRFYRSFYLYPTSVFTIGCCYSIKTPGSNSISAFIVLKLVTTGMFAFLAYAKQDMNIYYNAGANFGRFTALACCLDLLIFLLVVYLIK